MCIENIMNSLEVEIWLMNKSFNRITSLLSLTKHISGRKKFQKLVHILQHKGLNFNENFKFHYYGPYSNELQLKIDALVMNGMIEEKSEDNAWGLHYYKYTLSNIKDFEVDPELNKYSSLIDYLNSQPAQVLELVSTVYYLLERKKNISADEAFLKSLSLKPDLKNKIEDAKNVYHTIESQYTIQQ